MTREEALEYRAKILRLIRSHGVRGTAKLEGRSPASISLIARGQRLIKRVPIEILKLEMGTGKMCRKCGNEATLISGESRLCVVCELTRLAEVGLIYIGPPAAYEAPVAS